MHVEDTWNVQVLTGLGVLAQLLADRQLLPLVHVPAPEELLT